MTAEQISQIFGIFALVYVFISMQTKNIRLIMICQIACNAFGAASYFCLPQGFSGAVIFLVAVAQSIILLIFRCLDKDVPKWLNIIFVIGYITASLLTFNEPLDTFPLVAAILCAIGISQKNPKYYRIIMLGNASTWLAYDIFVGAYTMLATHGFTVVSALWGIIRFDVLKKKSKDTIEE